MMAFFLLMWLLNATTEEQRKGLADYFSPNSVLSHNSSGTGQPFGGRTAFCRGRHGVRSRQRRRSRSASSRWSTRSRTTMSDVDRAAAAAPRRRQEPGTRSRRQAAAEAAAAAGRATALRRRVPVAAATAGAAATRSASRTRRSCAAELERREKQEFEQAAQQIREAVRRRSAAGGAGPPAGDRHDAGRAAHPDPGRGPRADVPARLGGAERARRGCCCKRWRRCWRELTQDISIAGHTDAAPFAGSGPHQLGTVGRPRQRDAPAAGRFRPAGVAHPQRDRQRRARPAVPADPLAAANRRIAIVVLRCRSRPHAGGAPVRPRRC